MISMLIFGMMATAFLILLLQTLVAHAELAIHNISCVESHYETPDEGNPYDLGDWKVNLEQVLGTCGWDWLVPIPPRLPIADGIAFETSWRERGDDSPELKDVALLAYRHDSPESLWRLYYDVGARPPKLERDAPAES